MTRPARTLGSKSDTWSLLPCHHHSITLSNATEATCHSIQVFVGTAVVRPYTDLPSVTCVLGSGSGYSSFHYCLTRPLPSPQSLEVGPRIVIDLDWEARMTENDIRHLLQQISFSYAANKAVVRPAHMMLTSYKGHIAEMAGKLISGELEGSYLLLPLPVFGRFWFWYLHLGDR